MTELEFQYCWNHLYFDWSSIQSASGVPITVLNPGRWNKGPGPDFNQAHIKIGHLDLYGDIELHLSASDWYKHGHHKDTSYNQVILHVVALSEQAEASSFNPVYNSNNEPIETVFIRAQDKKAPHTSISCYLTPLNESITEGMILQASTLYLGKISANILQRTVISAGFSAGFQMGSLQWLFKLVGKPHYELESEEIGNVFLNKLFEEFLSEPQFCDFSADIKAVGRGITVIKRIEFAQEIATYIKNEPLPDSISEFSHYFEKVKIKIQQYFGQASWSKHLIRSWLIPTCYTWASLIYQKEAMAYFLGKWHHQGLDIPESVQKSEVFQYLCRFAIDNQRSGKRIIPRQMLFDYYKIYGTGLNYPKRNSLRNQTGS